MCRVIIKNDMVHSGGFDYKVKAWSIPNKQLKYEFAHGDVIYDIVIGREGTPLANLILSISWDKTCRVSNLESKSSKSTLIAHVGPLLLTKLKPCYRNRYKSGIHRNHEFHHGKRSQFL